MNMHFPISTAVRFLWHDVDGAMRVSVGSTFEISRKTISIQSQSIPWPGSDVQVVVDLPATHGATGGGRLVGKGTVARIEQTAGRAFGFAAEVRFQVLRASDALPANALGLAAKAVEFPVSAYAQPAALTPGFGIDGGHPAFHALAEASDHLQSPAA